jgi:2-haloacid dehalogenase
MSISPSTITACVFDAYGTLFDTSSAVNPARAKLGAEWQEFAAQWRRKQLEYTWLRSLMSKHADFWHVTAEALDHTLAAFKRNDPVLRAELMQNYLALPADAATTPLLEKLRASGRKTAILSNGAPTMLTAIVNLNKLTRVLDAVLSIELVGVYKPHPSVYQLAVDRLATPAEQILFVSANSWDAAGAANFGFNAVWINRALAPRDGLPGSIAAEVNGLGDVAALLDLP